MEIVQFLTSILTKAKVDTKAEEIQAVLNNENLKGVILDDKYANLVNNSLMTLEAAENNSELRAKLIKVGRAEAFNGMDDEISSIMADLELGEEFISRLKEEKSTTKRQRMLTEEMKKLGKGQKGSAEVEEYKLKVNDLNKKLSDLQTTNEAALKKQKDEFDAAILNKDIESDLIGFRYIFPKETPVHTKLAAARTSVNTALAKAGAKIIMENGVKKLVKLDGTDFYDSANNKVEYQDFITSALSADNLLSAKEEPGGDLGGGHHKEPGESGKEKGDAQYAARTAADLDNLEKSLE